MSWRKLERDKADRREDALSRSLVTRQKEDVSSERLKDGRWKKLATSEIHMKSNSSGKVDVRDIRRAV